ncbi:hypothetical protein [Lysinibacillus xylanilyticus]|uniref:hypothetical protein n=1 Tax=Lysinibacillus xylanilyticus TaxID=582475 RepID=UPI003D030B7E
MDFLQKQMLVFTSKKYEEIYIYFNKELEIAYHKLFLICASLGARNGKSSVVAEKGREFRSNYFSNDERNLAYSIILNDESQGKNIELFNEESFHSEARKILESYAEGGMDILVTEVFGEKWDGVKLDKSYQNYSVDLLSYIVSKIKEVPF